MKIVSDPFPHQEVLTIMRFPLSLLTGEPLKILLKKGCLNKEKNSRSYKTLDHTFNYFPSIIMQGEYPLKKLSYIQFLYQMET